MQQGMRRLRIMLVCSSGGHLAQLLCLSPWWSKHQRMWVTFKGADSLSLLKGERVHWAYHPTTRHLPNAVRNFRLGISLVRRHRPDLVVSTGAGVAFPFFVAAKLWGARTVYIEVYDRIDLPTVTGRLCYPLSDLFVLQWEEQKRMYPKGEVVGALV
jgi:beta-1,4-N-acetylglucosaminyltransferase